MTTTLQQHIVIDDSGIAWIDDTNVKVIEVAIDQVAFGWSPEEIAYQHSDYLSLAQVHAALAHYHDNKIEFDARIQRQLRQVEEIKSRTAETPGRRKLRELGLRP